MKLPIKIDLNGGVGSVEVAGTDIAGDVTAVRASVDPRDGTRVTLEMRPGALHLADEQALVEVDDRTAAALEALGWTPPADDGTTVTVTETTTITETTEFVEHESVLTWHPLEGDPVEIPLYEHVELPAGIGELRSHTREVVGGESCPS